MTGPLQKCARICVSPALKRSGKIGTRRFLHPRKPASLCLALVTLHINGATRELPPLETIADLVTQLALTPATILVEHNGTALRREEWLTATLQENDKIEVLQIVAGG